MILNLLHRPKLTDTYRLQQEYAHKLNLKTTVSVSTRDFENKELIEMVKKDHEQYGDEIAIWLGCMKHHPDSMVWLLNDEQKMETVKYSIDKFKEAFGFAPKVVSNYVIDAHLMKMIKDYCPEVIACIAGCFEEGVKVFHGCNNSWYLFSEGMSWNPWYPSKTQSIRPAENEEDWAGVVAMPHLSRDLVLGYESRNDFFASHPANVQRGLANEGMNHAYDYNLADQYRMQEDFNDGFSYYQIHVGSGWLHGNPNIIDCDEITQGLYWETLQYMVELRENGELCDMYASEFAEYYKKNVPIGKSDIAVGKDILFGSGKHYFWIFNPDYRVLVDTFQGGSIGDLRPFAAKYESYTGSDSPSLTMNSYPYLIQSQYRSGVKHHLFDGSRTTVFVKHGEEELDMCFYPSKVLDVQREENCVTLTLKPVEMKFKDGFKAEIQTVYRFVKGADIEIIRKVLSKSDENEALEMTEYVKGCYGFTEYPENMKGIGFTVGNSKVGEYDYNAKHFESENDDAVTVSVPQIGTDVTLAGISKPVSVEINEGHLFEPYYTMKLNYALSKDDKEVKSCLKIRKMTV